MMIKAILVLALAVAIQAQPPATFDLRTSKCAPAIVNQGSSGSSAVFAVVDALQGSFCYQSNKPVQISMDATYVSQCGRFGPSGTLADVAGFLLKNGTLPVGCFNPSQPQCPWAGCTSGQTDGCCTKGKPRALQLYSFDKMPSVQAMQQAIFNYGAVVAQVDATSWQTYTGGIASCSTSSSLNHVVYIIGWGTDSGQDYWLAANSWGSSWGESGYIRFGRGKNACLAESAAYAVVPNFLNDLCGTRCHQNNTLCTGSQCNTCTIFGCT